MKKAGDRLVATARKVIQFGRVNIRKTECSTMPKILLPLVVSGKCCVHPTWVSPAEFMSCQVAALLDQQILG